MFKQCFIVLGLKDAHRSNYNTFQGRELSTSKSVILKTRFAVLEEYHMMYSKKQCTNLKDIFYTLPYTMCFSFKQYQILWKGHCMRKRIHVWHRSRHVLLKWNALPFQKKCTCWREHSFQRDARLFSRESLKAFVLTEGFGSTMSISNSVRPAYWLPMFWHGLFGIFWHKSKTNLPNPGRACFNVFFKVF
jgi:hypothetical protein